MEQTDGEQMDMETNAINYYRELSKKPGLEEIQSNIKANLNYWINAKKRKEFISKNHESILNRRIQNAKTNIH